MIGDTSFQVTGRLNEDGEVSMKVTASCGYGDRKASVSADITDEKLLGQAASVFKKAIGEVRGDLQSKAVVAASEALVVASKKGEKV